MGATSIEWTDFSVNPIRARLRDAAHAGLTKGGYGSGVGHYCEKISPGCAFCYSSGTQARFGMPGFPGEQKGEPAVEAWFDESVLKEVLGRRIPTRFFWCDMTDLFGRWVPDEWIVKCFALMAITPGHTHQVLTKRTERMAECVNGKEFGHQIYKQVSAWLDEGSAGLLGHSWERVSGLAEIDTETGGGIYEWTRWRLPLANLWLGTSVEDQKRADERIPDLLRCPAAVRFLSVEPLLGPIDLANVRHADGEHVTDALRGETHYLPTTCIDENGPAVSWVIVGGESGPGVRPMDPRWARNIQRQCHAAGVPFFFKQWGKHIPCRLQNGSLHGQNGVIYNCLQASTNFSDEDFAVAVGKKAAGRMLDGRTWDEMPGKAVARG